MSARYHCTGCGQNIDESELVATGDFGLRDSHLIPGSVPDYCGPVATMLTPAMLRSLTHPEPAQREPEEDAHA